MAFKFVVFAAFVAVARASHVGYAAAPALALGGHNSISTYSTVQQHAPAVHAYAAHAAPVAYAAHAAPVAYAAAPVVHAAPVAYAAPVARAVIAEPSAPAHYDYGYSVSDPHTGDAKSQQESRRGDVVHGSYSLLESDGTKRTVEYTADDHHGFNAVVHKEPAAIHVAPVVAKVAAPVAYAAPVPHAYAAPAIAHGYSAYAAPAVAHGYAAHGYAAQAYAAPALAHGYAAPALAHGYAAHGYAAGAPVLRAAHNVW